MSTHLSNVTKKLTFGGPGEQILVLNDPSDTNALVTVEQDGTTPLTVNQVFNGIFINNISDFSCYFSLNPNIAAAPGAVDNVMLAIANDGMSVIAGFSTLRIYLAGAGSIYVTLF